ncbi:AraC family transcriptional regulator [Thalassobaculum sp.]|uniref:helix-turn-helix transcriptional regulator n=1 Tax=Thalassobaculum sp. TaxID=2022740 RepID=UPI003B5A8431
MTLTKAPDFLAYDRDGALGIDVLQAAFSGPAFERHAHATFAIGLTMRGLQRFNHRGRRHTSTPGRIIAFNPGDPHDGEAADESGFAYWMLYPDDGVWERVLEDAIGRAEAPFFADTLLDDPAVARIFAATMPDLQARATDAAGPRESLAAESRLELLLLALALRHGRAHLPGQRDQDGDPGMVSRIREILHADFESDIRLDDLARETGRSRFQVNRAFQAATGMPPHRYLTNIRLEQARRMLAAGDSPAEVAAAVGFADQSHLSRRFKAAYGVTPGRFQSAYRV